MGEEKGTKVPPEGSKTLREVNKKKRSFNLRVDTIETLEIIMNHHGLSDRTAALEFVIHKEYRCIEESIGKEKKMKPVTLTQLRGLIGQNIKVELINHDTKIVGGALEWGILTATVRLVDVLVNAQTHVLEYLHIEDSSGSPHYIERGLVRQVFGYA